MFWSTMRKFFSLFFLCYPMKGSITFHRLPVSLLIPLLLSGLVKGVAKAPEIDEEDMNVVFTTNVTGLINMTQAILPIFQKRPNGGQGDIINIGSIAGM